MTARVFRFRDFAVWSILFFILPLGLAVTSRLYALAAVLAGVIVFSFFNHLSGAAPMRRLDVAFAWLLMLSHLVLCWLGGFAFPYFLFVLILVPCALYFYGRSRNGHDPSHGYWHLLAAAISVCSQLTFLAHAAR